MLSLCVIARRNDEAIQTARFHQGDGLDWFVPRSDAKRFLKLLPNIKWIQIIDFLNVNVRHKFTHFTNVVQQISASIALNVGHHALLVRGRVVVPSQLVVEPDAAAALIGIAVAAQGRVVELE